MSPTTKNPLFKAVASVFIFLLSVASCSSPTSQAPAAIDTSAPPAADLAAISQAGCTAVTTANREDSLADYPFASVNDSDWLRGPSDAAITIIEYSDFQCPYCADLAPVLAELESRYPNELGVVYRHFPLIGTAEQPIHEKAALSAQASEAAGIQGKFWEMHDLLFVRQAEWTDLAVAEFNEWLLSAAVELDLDREQFAADLYSEELVALAETAWQEGQTIGLGGTPVLLINGFPYQGPSDINNLDAIIQLELLREQQFHECPEFTIDADKDYIATLRTEKGDIVIQLFPHVAPFAVNNFIFLAENDWFDNVTFHRVLPGFMAQAGDPTGTGYGGPGYTFSIEINSNLVFDRPGLLAMANSGPTSNGSQFFITLESAEHLNGAFTIFGEVLTGMDVVESLTPRDPSSSAGLPPGDLILDVIIETD